MLSGLRDFLKLEAASGIVLVAAAAIAMIAANSALSDSYASLIEVPVEIRVGNFEIAKPLLLWINDGLMAVFFLLIGLELKRELVEGQLSNLGQIALPAFGALGGILVPAAIYVSLNLDDGVALQGWAIPAATDIAFALAVVGLLGDRVPLSLRVFLVSLAIIDDIAAIAIIAVFYTSELSVLALGIAGGCVLALLALNRRGVLERTPYLMIGIVMWVALIKSGVHATLAGVVLALFIPIGDSRSGGSPLHSLEHDLHTAVAFGILPLFAFANAGIPLLDMSWEHFVHPVSFGIAIGLFVGKQLGVFLACFVAVRLGLAQLPAELGWRHLYGAALLCGIGFTMSLFIASLAFENTGVNLFFDERVGIITGSMLSGISGYVVLRLTLPPAPAQATK